MIPHQQYGILINKGTTLEGNKLIRHYEQVPNAMEKHIFPRPIQIVYIETIEEPWRQMALELERKYVALILETQNRKLNGYQRTENNQVQDINQCEELESEIGKLEQQLKQLDEEYNDKMSLLQQLQEQETRIESTSFDQEQQLEEAKAKFKKLNGLNSDINEQIVMLEAQVEAMKHKSVTKNVVKTTTTQQIHVI